MIIWLLLIAIQVPIYAYILYRARNYYATNPSEWYWCSECRLCKYCLIRRILYTYHSLGFKYAFWKLKRHVKKTQPEQYQKYLEWRAKQ